MGLLETLKFSLPRKQVTLPGFPAPVWIRQMTAAQAEDYFAEVQARVEGGPVYAGMASLVARCLCDEAGNLLAQQDGPAQVMQLGTDAVVALYEACADVNGMRKESVEGAAKN